MKLIGIGEVKGTPAGEIKVGDTMNWNYGGTNKVSKVEFTKSGKTIIVSFEGQEDVRKYRITTEVSITVEEIKEEKTKIEIQRELLEVTIKQIRQEGRIEIELNEDTGKFYCDILNIKTVSVSKFYKGSKKEDIYRYTKEALKEIRKVVEFYRENINKFLKEMK